MDYARRLAHDMACGDWDEGNVIPLALCSHGAVIRGLHRLQVVEISRVPRAFFIARDVPHRVRYISRGKARTAADALGAVGVATHRKVIAGAMHLVHGREVERGGAVVRICPQANPVVSMTWLSIQSWSAAPHW